MKILAVETSGKTFSIALNDCGKTVAEFFYDCGHIHSEMVVPLVEKILKDTGSSYENIDKFAVCAGPGSFTGIRVAMTAVKTFAQVLNKPVVVTDTLTLLEKAVEIKGLKVVGAVDALRDEVYVKSGGKAVIKSIDTFCKSLSKHKNKVLVVGNAAIAYKTKISKALGAYAVSLPESFHYPKASVLASLAQNMKGVNFDKIEPLYIRRSWAEEAKK
ncbi:MAG: tRNA (adenosine(37)-N6)-threonylcarbamoyltransferase complex dimerization subunit type 1 TsaB [Endomicrobia bacterium]|nr:tRNA (adenosine(37)-N6)-threonylcarbamoyltransferase complex dimerization subunit type 1 TsaB [Endomicrobiia bacterium]